jgi:hypothetical protein
MILSQRWDPTGLRVTGDAGNVDANSDAGFLLCFFDVGTEVGAGAGAGVGWGEAVAEVGECAPGD